MPRRGLGTREGRAALVHAVAHIEFNAINLALDAVYRFRSLPRAYYDDWLRVADEEARHFMLLADRLTDFGMRYGDLPAHNGLWEMAVKTADDWLLRMALVPRVLEARGLDVTPGMIERLRQAGDMETVAALEVILREEVGHVAIGSRWFEEARGDVQEPYQGVCAGAGDGYAASRGAPGGGFQRKRTGRAGGAGARAQGRLPL
ncbi:MAG: ferritin-like domain-containing protein [Acidihalobacter sp.]